MSYTILFPNYTIGEDAFTEIPKVCRQYGRKIAVIGGKTALSKAQAEIEEAVKGSDLEILDVLWHGGDATLEHVEELKNTKRCKKQICFLVLAVVALLTPAKW